MVLNNYNFYDFYYINFDDNMYTRPYVNTYTPLLNQYMLEDLTGFIVDYGSMKMI